MICGSKETNRNRDISMKVDPLKDWDYWINHENKETDDQLLFQREVEGYQKRKDEDEEKSFQSIFWKLWRFLRTKYFTIFFIVFVICAIVIIIVNQM